MAWELPDGDRYADGVPARESRHYRTPHKLERYAERFYRRTVAVPAEATKGIHRLRTACCGRCPQLLGGRAAVGLLALVGAGRPGSSRWFDLAPGQPEPNLRAASVSAPGKHRPAVRFSNPSHQREAEP